MKKLFVLVVIITVFCVGCMPTTPQTAEANVQLKTVQPTQPTSPTGSYILVRYSTTGAIGEQSISADLVFNNAKICTWDLGSTQPWERGEEVLFFAPIEGNCSEMDSRNGVSWYVNANYAEVSFEGKFAEEIPIWTLSGSVYNKLAKN